MGIVGVILNNKEISNRKQLSIKLDNYQSEKQEFQEKMKTMNLKTDSISFYYNQVCECNIDSIVARKLINTSNEDDFNKVVKVLKDFRNIEYNLIESWKAHLYIVSELENFHNEKREPLNIGELIIYKNQI